MAASPPEAMEPPPDALRSAERPPAPRSGLDDTSWLEFLAVSWATPLLKFGQKYSLTQDDMDRWGNSKYDLADERYLRFQTNWTRLEAEGKTQRPPTGALWITKSPSMLSFYRGNERYFWAALIIFFINRVTYVCQPFLLKEALDSMAEDSSQLSGVIWVTALASATMVTTVLHNTHFIFMARLGTWARTATMTAVYAKSLRIPNPQSVGYTGGQIVNLMSSDATNIFMMWLMLAFMLCDPFVIAIALLCIVLQVGHAGWVAVFLMILLIPIQFHVARSIGAAKATMLAHTDERVKLTSEIINAIRVIKFYAWERPMRRKVEASREAELRSLWKLLLLKSLNLALTVVWPTLVTMMTFFTSVWIEGELKYSMSEVVTTLAFISLLRRPLTGMPMALACFAEGLVSIRRLDHFLRASELQRSSDIQTQIDAASRLPHREPDPDEDEHKSDSSAAPEAFRVSAENSLQARKVLVADYKTGPDGHDDRDTALMVRWIAQPGSGVAAFESFDLMSPTTKMVEETIKTAVEDRLDVYLENVSFSFIDVGGGEAPATEIILIPEETEVANEEDDDGFQSLPSSEISLSRPLDSLSRSHRPSLADFDAQNPASVELQSFANEAEFGVSENGVPLAVPAEEGEDLEKVAKPELDGLHRVNLKIKRGDLVGVVGRVGSGKSSLLLGLLGELHQSSGCVAINDDVAYVSQEPWILNETIRENILFGRPLQEEFYQKVLESASLTQDLSTLGAGDLTEVGARGVNLSGGQKARISIARAAYGIENTQLYLLDDPFSALDAGVAQHVFQNIICDILAETTRLVVLNSQVHLLAHFDQVIVLEDGRVAGSGTYEEMAARFPDVCTVLDSESGGSSAEEEEVKSPPPAATVDSIPAAVSAALTDDEESDGGEDDESAVISFVPADSVGSGLGEVNGDEADGADPEGLEDAKAALAAAQALTSMETKSQGRVGINVLAYYVKSAVLGFFPAPETSVAKRSSQGKQASGLPVGTTALISLISLIVLAYTVNETVRVICDLWLTVWTDQSWSGSPSLDSDGDYMTVYAVVAASMALLLVFRTVLVARTSLHASKTIHNRLFASLLQAPVNLFFDVTPTGRIVNRFSQDMTLMDVLLADGLANLFQNVFVLLGIIILAIAAVPWFGILIVLLLWMFVRVRNFFIDASRDLKRLEGTSRSPIFSWFSSSLAGLPSIRAFGRTKDFTATSRRLMDQHIASFSTYILSSRWLSLRLDALSALVVLLVGWLAVMLRDSLDLALSSLSLSYTLQLTGFLQMAVRLAAEAESNMTAVERLKEYEDHLPSERVLDDLKTDPGSHAWPTKGSIDFRDVWMRYRPGLPYVLRGVTFSVRGGEHIGIVGRTGSGKSSLIQALFNIVQYETGLKLDGQGNEAPEGRAGIFIDGYNIQEDLSLETLRSQLTIIPQDPQLVPGGTVRENLDPEHRHPEEEIWDTLRRLSLEDKVQRLGGLDVELGEDGGGLSVGQRQLLCIGRALVRRSKVVVMDEATSRVDGATDQLIQETMRECFRGVTVLTIAHRLDTIRDSDRILVLKNGRVEEFDAPEVLLGDPGSLYAEMVRQHDHHTHEV